MSDSVRIEEGWKRALAQEFNTAYWSTLTCFVKNEYAHKKVFPPPKYVFNAFNACPFDAAKVVIVGQDPYHGDGQAHGLAFSVPNGVRIPPSLQNVYKEIQNDVGIVPPQHGDLTCWARQGVLLLNATLTVRAHEPGSHQGKGWELFTDAAIKILSEQKERVVFMLWGNYAKAKGAIINQKKHLILEAAHPSPYSAHSGFFGCKHFSKANAYLKKYGIDAIDWGCGTSQ